LALGGGMRSNECRSSLFLKKNKLFWRRSTDILQILPHDARGNGRNKNLLYRLSQRTSCRRTVFLFAAQVNAAVTVATRLRFDRRATSVRRMGVAWRSSSCRPVAVVTAS